MISAASQAGFNSELKAAKILNQKGWRVDSNVYYIDKDENKGRELDISSYKLYGWTDSEPPVTCSINLCIEVKKTTAAFLFFSNEKQTIKSAGNEYNLESGSGYGLLHWKQNIDRHVLPAHITEKKNPSSSIELISRAYCGYSKGGEQNIKSGIHSAVKAAIYMKDNCDDRYTGDSRDITFFVPILVVDGEVFDCTLNQDGSELQSMKKDFLVYSQNYMSPKYGGIACRVNVVTLKHLKKHLSDLHTWMDSIYNHIRQNRLKLKD